eukprot:Gb_11672 [translate_table: standard]
MPGEPTVDVTKHDSF